MNTQEDKKIDEIIEQALQYIENGKSQEEVFDIFPTYREELKAIFFATDLIRKEAGGIYPEKEIFGRVMAKIPTAVTNKENHRYIFMKEASGRSSWSIINNLNKIINTMKINWKIITPIGIVAVIALALLGTSPIGSEPSQTIVADNEQAQETPVAIAQDLQAEQLQPATGDIDETVNAILAANSAEESYFADVIKDSDLVDADSQSINNFGQSYYENEF